MRTQPCPHCCGSGCLPDWALLGKELRRRRVLAGVSLRKVARQAGMSAAHLSDMERGNRSLGGPKAKKVLAIFGLRVTHAFTEPLEAWTP